MLSMCFPCWAMVCVLECVRFHVQRFRWYPDAGQDLHRLLARVSNKLYQNAGILVFFVGLYAKRHQHSSWVGVLF